MSKPLHDPVESRILGPSWPTSALEHRPQSLGAAIRSGFRRLLLRGSMIAPASNEAGRALKRLCERDADLEPAHGSLSRTL